MSVAVRARRFLYGAALATLWAASAAVAAQEDDVLARAEELADSGEATAALEMLSRWEKEGAGSATRDALARAWYLRGRLTQDAKEAELHYLRVVIEGSDTRVADDALLRLALYQFADGDYARSIEYLGRLRRDYPTSELGPEALLWISRSSRALGRRDEGCRAADQGLREVAPVDTALYRALGEARAGCAITGASYSVQVAALQDAVAAARLAQQLLDKGYSAWILNATARDPMHRVRVGRGLGESEARQLLARLTEAGFSPFLVSERNVQGG